MKQKQFFQDQTNSAPLDIRNHECKDVRTCTGNVHAQTRVHINGRARTYTHTCIHHTPIHTFTRELIICTYTQTCAAHTLHAGTRVRTNVPLFPSSLSYVEPHKNTDNQDTYNCAHYSYHSCFDSVVIFVVCVKASCRTTKLRRSTCCHNNSVWYL